MFFIELQKLFSSDIFKYLNIIFFPVNQRTYFKKFSGSKPWSVLKTTYLIKVRFEWTIVVSQDIFKKFLLPKT